jgi:polyisoprenyl-teichoic acid--peptidoglycan teichoic acid transferase
MLDIQKNYKAAGKNIEEMTIKENGTKINGIYYGVVNDEGKQRIQDEMKAQLELNE